MPNFMIVRLQTKIVRLQTKNHAARACGTTRPKINIPLRLCNSRSLRGPTCQVSWSCDFKPRRLSADKHNINYEQTWWMLGPLLSHLREMSQTTWKHNATIQLHNWYKHCTYIGNIYGPYNIHSYLLTKYELLLILRIFKSRSKSTV